MKKAILPLFILISAQVIGQQTLEKGIQTLVLKGATAKNSTIEITGTGVIQNNKAVSPSETVLEEIDLDFMVSVSSYDNKGTFRYGLGRQTGLAGTYVEISGDSTQSKVTVNRMDNNTIYPVKEYELPFVIHAGEIYKVRLGKRIRRLIVELTTPLNHFITDTLKYPSPFFGLEWGIPFIACANGTISISDYQLSTPFNLSPRLAVWGDSFIEGSSLDNDKLRYISFIKDSIGYENIAIMGKGGEGSGSMSNRFASELKWFQGSMYALVAIGVNDVDFTSWKTNMTEYIRLLKQKGIIPVIVTITPREDRSAFIAEANKWIRTAYNGAYVDINKVVATDDINWIPGSCMSDKVHPTAASHNGFFHRIAEEAPYLFRDSKAFTIDYKNEMTLQNVTKSIEYDNLSQFSNAQTGTGNPVSVNPGQDLYFRETDPAKSKTIYDVLLVPNRPAAPETAGPGYVNGVFDWINTPGYQQVSNYEYSVDNGISWTTCTEKPIQNNSTKVMDIRVKAGSGNFKSLALHIDHVTTIATETLAGIQMYPNPVKNKLYIDHVEDDAVISIFTINGTFVKTIVLVPGSNSVSLEELPNGFYMGIIVNKGSTRSIKILKQDF